MYSIHLVKQMVQHFASLAGWEGQRFLITFDKRVFDRAAKRHGAALIEDGDYGASLVCLDSSEPEPYPVVWINPNITNFNRLSQTCAHEALHAARPNISHGAFFEAVVRKLMRGMEP